MHGAMHVNGRGDQRTRHDTVVEHSAGAVDVGEKRLEGAHPLRDAPGYGVPFRRHDHPRHEVEREGPLLAAHRKGHAAVGEHARQLLSPEVQIVGFKWLEGCEQHLVGRARHARQFEHLIPGLRQDVVVEDVSHLADPRK